MNNRRRLNKMNNLSEYLNRKKIEFGDKFDDSDLSKQFGSYLHTDKRIKVKFSYGEVKTGRVGVTTGWKPSFILLLRSNSRGSSWLLSDEDMIV
jgi:hypothetical protein